LVLRTKIVDYLNEMLKPGEIKDSTFNGLQIEGAEGVERIAFSVDSGLAVFEKALELECEMVIVHHGLIWRGWNRVKGADRKRLKVLLENNINLYVSHLPLDLHPDIGNNSEILRVLKAKKDGNFGEVGYTGSFTKAVPFQKLISLLKSEINPNLTSYQYGDTEIEKIAVSSGGFNLSLLEEAAEKGIQTIITGEAIGKSTFFHPVKENKMNLICAGHYQTETLGLKALMKKLNVHFKDKVNLQFLDITNDW
jgi:dinuclear metal center YbgI/SA1388 family protein